MSNLSTNFHVRKILPVALTLFTLISNAAPTKEASATIDGREEFILFDQVKINGRLPLKSSKAQLFKELGRPDSLAKPDMASVCVSFYDKPFTYAYFKESHAELYGDVAVVSTLEFVGNPRLKLTTPTVTLSSRTTLPELVRYFPNAVKARSEMDVHRKGKYMTVHIATGKTAAEDYWILFFRNGRLARLDYWMPC